MVHKPRCRLANLLENETSNGQQDETAAKGGGGTIYCAGEATVVEELWV